MLKKLLKNKKFLLVIKKFLKQKGILDIILFGSIVRGKEKPEDIDLLILYCKKQDIELNFRIRKELEKIGLNPEIVGKTYKEAFDPEFLARESILQEGYSMKKRKFLASCFGYSNFVLLKYKLQKMNKSERMRFYYSLYGRGGKKGVLEKNSCYKFSESIIISPVERLEEIKSFLESWKIKYVEIPVLIPKRIVDYKIFEK